MLQLLQLLQLLQFQVSNETDFPHDPWTEEALLSRWDATAFSWGDTSNTCDIVTLILTQEKEGPDEQSLTNQQL